jgi:hypothetical protein
MSNDPMRRASSQKIALHSPPNARAVALLRRQLMPEPQQEGR